MQEVFLRYLLIQKRIKSDGAPFPLTSCSSAKRSGKLFSHGILNPGVLMVSPRSALAVVNEDGKNSGSCHGFYEDEQSALSVCEALHYGVKKIAWLEGPPTAICEGANSAYSYNANGFLTSKTDWKGNATTYTHDDCGLELSRTEAVGTPEARTITTEWHRQFCLPTAQGRQLSRSVQSSQ